MFEALNPEDIAERLNGKYPIWDKSPKVILQGKSKTFGKLIFRFPEKDISFSLYLKDKRLILNMSLYVVEYFNEFMMEKFKYDYNL